MGTFFDAYIRCALWSSTDEKRDDGGDPLDQNYDQSDIHPETLAQMQADCDAFEKEHLDYIICDLSKAGHDFWLTRNEHGAGFWDGDWPEPAATRLDEAATAFGRIDLYVGDDGLIYGT